MKDLTNTLTFLGTGTSQGVPVIACSCPVCISDDIRDKRLRTSAWIQADGVSLVIDTGPDFRQQMLRADVQNLDAVLFTHEHKDHVAGLDDVRAFNFKQKSDMPLYGNANVEEALKREFHYAFAADRYPGVPQLDFNLIHKDSNLTIKGLDVRPIQVLHGNLPILGFRIKDLVYLTDVSRIEELEREKIYGAKVLVINALRRQKHKTHLNLEEALQMIEELGVEENYLIHISHLFDTHENIEAELPEGVHCAIDQQTISF